MTNQLIVSAKTSAGRRGKPVLTSVVTPAEWTDPADFFARRSEPFAGSRFFWSQPDRKLTFVGLGEALSIEIGDSFDRFGAANRIWREIVEQADLAGDFPAFTGPLLFGGFAFNPGEGNDPLWRRFPSVKLTVPRFLLTVHDGRAWLTENRCLAEDGGAIDDSRDLDNGLAKPDDGPEESGAGTRGFVRQEEPGAEVWMESVAKAASAIRSGKLEKVVLSRRMKLAGERRFRPEAVLDRLLREQPNTYVFAIEHGSDCLIGASPERLIKKSGNRFLTLSLAGSAARGRTEEEDIRLGEFLFQDRKNLLEHSLAVTMIRSVLEAICDGVSLPDAPQLYKLKDIQHLLTPIEGIARPGVSLLDAVEALHPTPALGGTPKEAALAMIRELEQVDRGWYAAPIGWIDWRMDGEFAAAIRSALLRGKEATLFAGCGIVGDSDPAMEYRETDLKFRPMLSALGAGEVNMGGDGQ